MGGIGSGTWMRMDNKTKLDDGLQLGINKLLRDKTIRPGVHAYGEITWTSNRTGKEKGSVSFEANMLTTGDEWLRLAYKCTIQGEEQHHDYKIFLTSTDTNFGGKRYWFKCPVTMRRCAKLYQPPGAGRFASRYAYPHLQFRSQSKSAHDRAIDRMWKKKDALGGDTLYRKPKGMHKATHKRKMMEVFETEAICDAYLGAFCAKFIRGTI